MRRKRYKQGHITLLSLEASTLNYRSIDERVTFHTNRKQYRKLGDSGLPRDHRVASYCDINDEGSIIASYVLTLDPKDLEEKGISLSQLVKNARKSIEACIDNWSRSVAIKKISYAKTPDGKITLWIIISTQAIGYASHIHGNFRYIVYHLAEADASKLLDIFAPVHYVIITCLLEYPGYFISGKVE
jgi:hypothetical protein